MENHEDFIDRTISTYDKIAAGYCRKTRLKKYLDWEEKYIQKMLFLTAKQGPEILDVGCGDGRHCRLIDKNGGKAIGIDLSESMIRESKLYYPDGEFQLMDMRKLDFDDNRFNGLWSSGSIYHVSKKEIGKVLSEFVRVLRNNGILAISFKLGSGEGLEANPKSYGGSARYFAYYTEPEMVALLESFGFEKIESCNYPEEVFGDNLRQIWLRLKK